MALRETAIPVRFVGGIETAEDEKGVLPVKLLALENGVFETGGSIVKRHGYDVLGYGIAGAAPSLAPDRGLATRNNELLAFTEDAAYTHTGQEWSPAGVCDLVAMSRRAVVKTGGSQVQGDSCEVGGISVYAWVDSSSLYYSVLDDAGGVLVPPTLIAASRTRPSVRAIGGNAVIIFADTASGVIYTAAISPSEPKATLTPIGITNDLSLAYPIYDVDASPYCTHAAIGWVTTNGGTSSTRIGWLTNGGLLGSSATSLPAAVAGPAADNIGVAIDQTASSPDIAYAYMSGTTVSAGILNHDLTAQLAATAVMTSVTGTFSTITCAFLIGASTQTVAVFASTVSASKYTTWSRTITAAAALGTQASTLTSELASRAWSWGPYAYAQVLHASTLWSTYFAMRHDGVIVARQLSGTAGANAAITHLAGTFAVDPPDAIAEADDLYSFRYNARAWIGTSRAAVATGDDDVGVFAEPGMQRILLERARPSTQQLGQTAYVSGGGFLWEYDATSLVEAGFFYAPDDIATPVDASTGGEMSDGTFGYVCCYEWINAQGERERGPVSTVVDVTVNGATATQKVTLTLPCLHHTLKRALSGTAGVSGQRGSTDPMTAVLSAISGRKNVSIAVFRSEDGTAGAYYRVSSLDPSTAGSNNGYVANDPAALTVSFIDGMSDADLIAQDPLYTNGEILSNDGWESGSALGLAKGRIWSTDAAEPNRVRFSQERAEGYALEQPAELSVTLDPLGGEVTAIAPMDDAVVLFKARAVYYVAGPGPLANPNAGGGFSAPQLITSDTGCTEPRSVVMSPVGVAFKSAKGIYLLGRDRTLQHVGSPVDGYNDQEITAATLLEDRQEIRFLTSSGLTLVWDYGYNQWSTFTRHEGVDARMVAGIYHYLRNDGTVWAESDGYLDGTANITLGIETAWIKLAGYLQGFQKLWYANVLGEYLSAHTLRVKMAFDYQEGWAYTVTVDPTDFIDTTAYGAGAYGAGAYGGNDDGRYQFTVHIGEPCEAARFRFEDHQDAGAGGASFGLSELLLHGGVKSPRFHDTNARSY